LGQKQNPATDRIDRNKIAPRPLGFLICPIPFDQAAFLVCGEEGVEIDSPTLVRTVRERNQATLVVGIVAIRRKVRVCGEEGIGPSRGQLQGIHRCLSAIAADLVEILSREHADLIDELAVRGRVTLSWELILDIHLPPVRAEGDVRRGNRSDGNCVLRFDLVPAWQLHIENSEAGWLLDPLRDARGNDEIYVLAVRREGDAADVGSSLASWRESVPQPFRPIQLPKCFDRQILDTELEKLCLTTEKVRCRFRSGRSAH
jgi:hypothetical protein